MRKGWRLRERGRDEGWGRRSKEKKNRRVGERGAGREEKIERSWKNRGMLIVTQKNILYIYIKVIFFNKNKSFLINQLIKNKSKIN